MVQYPVIEDLTIKDLANFGYDLFIKLREQHQSPVIQLNIKGLSLDPVCVYGQEAAKIFYDPRYFRRGGAMPKPVRATLLGDEGVQNLDGKAHQHRKKAFMDLMAPAHIETYRQLLTTSLEQAMEEKLASGETFNLLDFSKIILAKTICGWSDVPLEEEEAEELADTCLTMAMGAAGGVRLFSKGVLERNRAEKWAAELIEKVRQGRIKPAPESALAVFSFHTDPEGKFLEPKTAAVELLNIIRPTILLAVWISFLGHALFSREDIRKELLADFDNRLDPFIQEMRRFYPFFPMLPAYTIREVEIDGYTIPADQLVILDLYGTDHDARTVADPESFAIRRFEGRGRQLSYEEQYEMIAQGGGDFHRMHRCAGEWITLVTLETFTDFLLNRYRVEVPQQDWSIPLHRMPTMPQDKAVVRLTGRKD